MRTSAKENRRFSSALDAIAGEASLLDPAHFRERARALEYIESARLDWVELKKGDIESRELKDRAEILKRRLEQVNVCLFQELRRKISIGQYANQDFRNEIEGYMQSCSSGELEDKEGFDALDSFVQGLLLFKPAPDLISTRGPEMVPYQPTPARIVFQLAAQPSLAGDGLFYDLGSGLGQVPILMRLMRGIQAKGIEIEPAYCDYAKEIARELNLSGVEFINSDVREVEMTDGSVFFMFTPFTGKLLRDVLQKLRALADQRTITIYSYGPSTLQIAEQAWLRPLDGNSSQVWRLSGFGSD